MNVETKQEERRPEWMEEADNKWWNTDSHERQVILAHLFHECVVNQIIGLKYKHLYQMDRRYAEAIARKLGFEV